VATGLNRVVQQSRGRGEGFASHRETQREPLGARDGHGGRGIAAPRRQAPPTLAPVPQSADYTGFDKPAVQRYARAVGDGVGASSTVDEELLDIPAFLRRQAD
jgi:hypothetical protein